MQLMLRENGVPLLCLSAAFLVVALLPCVAVAEGVTPSEARRLRDEVGQALQIRHF
jgi:ER degradation enhancer, mannosidase alpha-like 2